MGPSAQQLGNLLDFMKAGNAFEDGNIEKQLEALQDRYRDLSTKNKSADALNELEKALGEADEYARAVIADLPQMRGVRMESIPEEFRADLSDTIELGRFWNNNQPDDLSIPDDLDAGEGGRFGAAA